MKCFWIDGKQCPYLLIREHEEGIIKEVDSILQHFTVKEICEMCLLALNIKLRG